MYSLKLHDKVYDDLKVLDNALVIKVFKKLKDEGKKKDLVIM